MQIATTSVFVSHWLLRFCLWLVAVVFCLLPIGLTIARDPASVARLMDVTSYVGFAKDMILSTIAILAIGLVDAFDGIADRIHSRQRRDALVLWSCIIILVIVLQLVVYSFWSASMTPSASTTTWPYLVCAVASSFIARVAMLA